MMDQEIMMLISASKKKFLTTSSIDNCIKHIKRINQLFIKFEKENKDTQIQEILNILRTMNNEVRLSAILSVLMAYVKIDFHEDLEHLVFAVETSC